ncbi:kinase-like domain-containing protein [Aspergillus karnatakaensis]|uniref:protein kinase family protein n=1 Tax=Aspergillus karnatakaensis TaxID=1810916 RepID=UPI003CCCF027
MMEMGQACHNAKEQFYGRLYPPDEKDHEKHYLPRSVILEIFSTDDCLRTVYLCDCNTCTQDSGRSSDQRALSFDPDGLLEKYATVFALLICLDRAGLICWFQRNQTYLDGAQFFTREGLQFLSDEGVLRQVSLFSDILKRQYEFQVRPLKRSPEYVRFSSQEILPIRQDKERKGKGMFGEVYGFEIPYDEYRGVGLEKIRRFARKVFVDKTHNTGGLKEWVKCLYSNKVDHPHLMPALTAFWHNDQFSIVFEEAQQTLAQYLESEGGLFHSDELWDQVQGLAEALAYLHGKGSAHEIIAYHGDLKPANILIVNRLMKIADFGLLKIHVKNSNGLAPEVWSPPSNGKAFTLPYASPGGPDASMDVWSLGAILSEIATFDLEDTGRLALYREARLQDVDPRTPDFKSCAFHHDGPLKRSVTKKIGDLQAMVEESQPRSNNRQIPTFQQNFFNTSFFSLLREMLSDNLGACPSAEKVAEILQENYDRAQRIQQEEAEAITPDDRDLWEDVRMGRIYRSPDNANCRLCATLLEAPLHEVSAKCGLLLDLSKDATSILIRCILYGYCGSGTYCLQGSLISHSGTGPKFTPSYNETPNGTQRLEAKISQPDKTVYRFMFRDIKGLLALQAALTKQYPFQSRIFHLQRFALSNSTRLLKSHRKCGPVLENAILQLWTEEPLVDEQYLWKVNPSRPIQIHIAVLSMELRKLIMLQVTSEPSIRPTTVSAPGHVVLEGMSYLSYYELPIHDGLPMGITVPPGGYVTQHKEAKLEFGGSSPEESAKDFVKDLTELQRKWAKEKKKDIQYQKRLLNSS